MHPFVLGIMASLAMLSSPVPTGHGGIPQKVQPQNHGRVMRAMDWRRTPYSSGVIQAHMLRLGLLHPVGGFFGRVHNALTCSPAPCVFPNSVASGGTQPVNETPVAANPSNSQQLITGGNDYNCSTIQGFYTTPDGGTTWNRSCLTLAPGGTGGDGDPAVGYDLNGNVFRTGIDSTATGGLEIAFSKSTDNGVTWGAAIVAVNPLFTSGQTDKDWMEVDDNPSSPGKNNIYISVTQFDPSSNSQISVSHSTNGGASWSAPIPVGTEGLYPVVNQFSDLTIGKDGSVYVSWMQCTANGPTGDCGGTQATIYSSVSHDGGNTWSTPVAADHPNLAPDTCGAFYGCLPHTSERVSNVPANGIDNSTGRHHGRLYIVDYSYVNNSYMKVQVVHSDNGGGTWGPPHRVAPRGDTHDQFFPWLNIAPKGTVGVTWMDRRNDPSNLSYEEFGAFSNNGGRTYRNFQVAANPSNPNNDGFGGGFLGDYTGNSWAGTALYASWTDTSNGHTGVDMIGGILHP